MNMDSKNNNLTALDDDTLSQIAGGYNGQVSASGSFASQTGTSLNLLVSWTVTVDGFGQKTLYITVSSSSYSLSASALPNSLELTVNGMVYTATPNAINYSGSTMANNVLASFTVPNAVAPASITASWRFNGVYSGVALNTITASGIASF